MWEDIRIARQNLWYMCSRPCSSALAPPLLTNSWLVLSLPLVCLQANLLSPLLPLLSPLLPLVSALAICSRLFAKCLGVCVSQEKIIRERSGVSGVRTDARTFRRMVESCSRHLLLQDQCFIHETVEDMASSLLDEDQVEAKIREAFESCDDSWFKTHFAYMKCVARESLERFQKRSEVGDVEESCVGEQSHDRGRATSKRKKVSAGEDGGGHFKRVLPLCGLSVEELRMVRGTILEELITMSLDQKEARALCVQQELHEWLMSRNKTGLLIADPRVLHEFYQTDAGIRALKKAGFVDENGKVLPYEIDHIYPRCTLWVYAPEAFLRSMSVCVYALACLCVCCPCLFAFVCPEPYILNPNPIP